MYHNIIQVHIGIKCGLGMFKAANGHVHEGEYAVSLKNVFSIE